MKLGVGTINNGVSFGLDILSEGNMFQIRLNFLNGSVMLIFGEKSRSRRINKMSMMAIKEIKELKNPSNKEVEEVIDKFAAEENLPRMDTVLSPSEKKEIIDGINNLIK